MPAAAVVRQSTSCSLKEVEWSQYRYFRRHTAWCINRQWSVHDAGVGWSQYTRILAARVCSRKTLSHREHAHNRRANRRVAVARSGSVLVGIRPGQPARGVGRESTSCDDQERGYPLWTAAFRRRHGRSGHFNTVFAASGSLCAQEYGTARDIAFTYGRLLVGSGNREGAQQGGKERV